MVPSYLIGGWLWARGYSVEALHVRIFKSQLVDVEIRDAKIEQFRGQLIDIGLLREARTPMVMVGVAALGVLYLIGRVLAGPLAGLTMAALAVASPLSRTYLGQARSEPTLVFFLLLTLLLALVGARRGRDGRLPLGWAFACGVALGLAIGSKYTAILSLVGLLVWGLLAGAWCAWRAGPAAAGLGCAPPGSPAGAGCWRRPSAPPSAYSAIPTSTPIRPCTSGTSSRLAGRSSRRTRLHRSGRSCRGRWSGRAWWSGALCEMTPPRARAACRWRPSWRPSGPSPCC